MLDLVLAIGHHLLIFALFGVLFAEFVMVKIGMDRAAIVRTANLDLSYGVLAGLILIVGFSRAIFAAKGWTYYAHNGFFWAKIVTFLIIGLLSVPPTIRFIQWRRAGLAQRRRGRGRAPLSVYRAGPVRPAARLRRRHGAGLWRVSRPLNLSPKSLAAR